MKLLDTPRHNLLAAYKLILSPPKKSGPDSIRRLQLPTLKTAYRKKALETHPDRFKAIGTLASELNNLLIVRAWERGYNYKFADYAMHKGYITPSEHMALLRKQHRLQRPISEYFIGKKILSPRDMSRVLLELTLHNRNMTWTCRNGGRKKNNGKRRL